MFPAGEQMEGQMLETQNTKDLWTHQQPSDTNANLTHTDLWAEKDIFSHILQFFLFKYTTIVQKSKLHPMDTRDWTGRVLKVGIMLMKILIYLNQIKLYCHLAVQ